MRKITASIISLALLALAAAGPAEAAVAVAVAGPENGSLGWTTPDVVAVSGAPVHLVVADPTTPPHDFVAKNTFRSSGPWCSSFPSGRCPRFWTPRIGADGAAVEEVQGLDGLAPGEYDFYCTVHSAMQGTLTIVSPG